MIKLWRNTDTSLRAANVWFYDGFLIDPNISNHQDATSLISFSRKHKTECILVTHWHMDHFRGLGVLAGVLGLPIAAPKFNGGFGSPEIKYEMREGRKIHNLIPLHTPGHSPEHLCYFDDEVLVAGDLLGEEILVPEEGGDVVAFKKSLREVGLLGCRKALPGHGRPIRDIPKAIRYALTQLVSPSLSPYPPDDRGGVYR